MGSWNHFCCFSRERPDLCHPTPNPSPREEFSGHPTPSARLPSSTVPPHRYGHDRSGPRGEGCPGPGATVGDRKGGSARRLEKASGTLGPKRRSQGCKGRVDSDACSSHRPVHTPPHAPCPSSRKVVQIKCGLGSTLSNPKIGIMVLSARNQTQIATYCLTPYI